MLSPLPSNSDQQSRVHKYPSYTIGVLTDNANKFSSKSGCSSDWPWLPNVPIASLRPRSPPFHPSLMCLTLHQVPFTNIFSVASQTPQPSYSSQSCATPRSHMFYDFAQPAPLVVGAIFSVGVVWHPASCIVGHTRSDRLETLRGIEGWRNFVLHLAWKRTISTRDHISFHHHCHHLQIVYGQRFTAQDWGRWEGGQHIIIEDEEHWQQREGAGVGDCNGDSEGCDGIQTGSTLWYDQLNRFFISPTRHNLSLLSWRTNKKSLNCYCSSMTLALSRSQSKKCDAGRGRDTHRPQD